MTLAVAAASLAVALFLGMLGAACKLSGNGLLRRLAILYTTAIRGVPDLVLMLLIFYGGQMLVNVMVERLGLAEGIDVNPFVAGVLTIGFIFGAYLTETFRGAIQSIPPGQSEAARAYGMAPAQVLTRIVLPQMVRHAIPGFTNNWLVLLKSTALVSVIGLTDMMHKAGLAAGATREPFTFYLAVAALYLLFTSVSLLALSRLEARFSLGVRRSP
jgi:arginine/ornithine transport system permease protein